MKILIVDDDVHRKNSLREYLIDSNLVDDNQIYLAGNCVSAEDLLSRFHFDLMVLDVVLPKDSNTTKVDSKNSINLINKIARTNTLKKPPKIIGITAHLEDLGRFRKSFERDCLFVVEANRKSVGWRKKIAEYAGYDELARMGKNVHSEKLNVITIHGIRTFGEWQNRLESIINKNIMEVPFHSYKYGHFSFLALFSRHRHAQEMKTLSIKLISIFELNRGGRFVAFSHSFGTYLLLEVLNNLIESGHSIPISTVVLSGSVLPNDYDLSFLTSRGIRVINECATSDYVLWLSEAFVPGLGMAGKTGIYGFENQFFINRYFSGGHSSYFDGDGFMVKNWLPILDSSQHPAKAEVPITTAVEHDFLERVVATTGALKRRIQRRFRAVGTQE